MVIRKTIENEIKSIEEGKRTIWHKITAEIKDRLGDIVRIDGLDVSNFRKKPSVLYGHKYTDIDPLPVVAENVGFERRGKYLYAGTKFLDPSSVSSKLGDLIKDLWILNKKNLMGWSIGFLPLLVKDLEENGRVVGKDYKKSELLEYSNVVVPANAEAVNDMILRGIIGKGFSSWKRTVKGSSISSLLDGADRVLEQTTASCDIMRRFKGEEMSQFYFKRISEATVNKFKLMESKRTLELCRKRLGGIFFCIEWVEEAAISEMSKAETWPTRFLSQANLDSFEILIRADVSFDRVAFIISHECFHVWWSLSHHFPRTQEELDYWERVADIFAQNLAAEVFEKRQELEKLGYIVNPWQADRMKTKMPWQR